MKKQVGHSQSGSTNEEDLSVFICLSYLTQEGEKTHMWNHHHLHFTHLQESEWTATMNSSEFLLEQKAFSIFA